MNLAAIERMVRDGDLSRDALRYLIDCRGECEWLDYKERLSLENDKALCEFGRDVLALKNVGGGYILVGVRDKTWQPVGLDAPLPYDTKMLRDQVRKCVGVELDIDIVHHELSLGELFALLLVRSSRKRNKRRSPTVTMKDYSRSSPYGIQRGQIYVRKGDSTVKVSSQTELEDLLDALEAQADEDAARVGSSPSPFAVEDGLYRLLETGFERFIGRADLRERVKSAVTQDPRIWIINVHGPGGVGKSALVNWVSYEFYKSRTFEAIIQLSAKETILTPTGIRPFSRSLYSFENLLDHILSVFQEPLSGDLQSKKKLVIELLSAWSTLVVLDNLETVSDGRIMTFAQELPVGTRAKVLVTSRQKTGGWELPVSVTELQMEEVSEFLRVRSTEIGVAFPLDEETVRRVADVSGGLPLAIQWMMGQFKAIKDIQSVLSMVKEKDSPILEYSFRNVWNVVSPDAKAILSILTIFESPPTVHQLAIATEFPIERIEKALAELVDVTLVTRLTQQSDGHVLWAALPITLSFARHQLDGMGDFEVRCRQRLQRFTEQMQLQESELHRFKSIFDRYGLNTDNERRAAILCRRAESDMFSGNVDNAELLFRQARELAPQSAYVHAMGASYELARNRVGIALERANEACHRATKKTGVLCYTIKARVLDVQRDRGGRLEALERAMEYDPSDTFVRHQYGVALSRAGRTVEAVEEFTRLIEDETKRVPPHETLLMAFTTRIINLRRLGRHEEAQRDLDTAKDLLKKNPHLHDCGDRIAELDEDKRPGDSGAHLRNLSR